MGVVTRVRFDAEGRDLGDVLEALDEATALLRPQMATTVTGEATNVRQPEPAGFGGAGATSASIAIGGLRDEDGMPVDTEFVEEAFTSAISDGNGERGGEAAPEGAVYYTGRRVLKIVERPLDLSEPMR